MATNTETRWHMQMHLPDSIRIKLTILAMKQNTNRTALVTKFLTDALADVEIPAEFLDDSDDSLITED